MAPFTLRRRDTVVLVLSTWLANRLMGFGLMHYPLASVYVRAGSRYRAAVLATLAALAAADRIARLRRPAAIALPLASWPGESAPVVVAHLFAINVVAFGVLLCADRLLGGIVRRRKAGKAPRPATP